MEALSSGKDLLFTLLLKVGVAASLAALLARSAIFRKVLYTEERDSDQKVKLMLFMTPALAIGVIDRKSTRLNSSHIQKSRMPSSA